MSPSALQIKVKTFKLNFVYGYLNLLVMHKIKHNYANNHTASYRWILKKKFASFADNHKRLNCHQ